ncbi:gamma-glutamyltransferase [Sphingomonas quercus]|uniref:Glutathione hydrolase proenzyme n=1 Tax=Sphingomonas quercus TaxID=2842451 RepID=A0ABS6BGD9_9SPHN|nr:gamma-glutamyltransferase [Sphingomonas quercus]MBU3076887.1 gamma-glutamyltransferase [Sphingomonas quercus]
MFLRLFTALALLLSTVSPAIAAGGGMVSAADPRAAAAGQEILRKGGSAADAEMAMMLALTVVEPQSSGIGGGGFMLYQDARSNKLTSYDGREAAPAAAGPRYFYADGQPLSHSAAVPGGKSVGVPGNLRLMAMVHRQHGKLPWAALFQPAIRLARDGFAITPRMEDFLSRIGNIDSEWGKSYLMADGRPRPVGAILRNPDLAATLADIAARGADSFYVGPRAQRIVQTVNGARRNPSPMTAGDLAAYDAKERPAPCGSYRGWRICGMGPPSSGAVAVFQILKQLERFDMKALGKDSPTAWHLIAESMRLAYADRDAYLGDPDFVKVPVAGLMDPAYLAGRSQLIATDRSLAHAEPGLPPGAEPRAVVAGNEVPSTTHFVAIDAAGNVATMTSTIEGPWGSGLTVDGFFLNNELTDFDIVPEKDGKLVANHVEGGKRPRSSMAPTIVYAPDGSLRLAIGAAGGSTIIAQVAKALIGILDWGLSAQEAIALPQIYAPGDTVVVEQGTALAAMAPQLTALGNQVRAGTLPLKANAIERVNGALRGAADPRSEGVALAQ